jgi:hypothetical protein
MPSFKIDIAGMAYERLCAWAVAERRPISFEAEVLLFRMLGCWPYDSVSVGPMPQTANVLASNEKAQGG